MPLSDWIPLRILWLSNYVSARRAKEEDPSVQFLTYPGPDTARQIKDAARRDLVNHVQGQGGTDY